MELTEMDLCGWIQTTVVRDKHAIQAELTWGVLLRREGSGEREIQREAERQTETGGREEEKEEEGIGQVPPFKGMGAQRHTADQSTACLPGPQGVGPDVPGC